MSHLVDFEFQIPCTFYNPMITVSAPKGFKVNSLRLLPSLKAGKFQDTEDSCDGEGNFDSDSRTEKVDGEQTNSQALASLTSQLYQAKSSKLVCELSKDSERELLEILTSIGFQSWEVISQNTSKCIDIPEYEHKGSDALSVMGNLVNGSYILRLDIQNPQKEETSGHWNLSITSTKNALPTFPFCLTDVSHNSVSNTIGYLIGPINITNTTFDSYYTASQKGELQFTINSPDWNHSSPNSSFWESSLGILEPLRVRLTFPLCQDPNSCYSMRTKYSDSFCQIYGHKYECYVERFRPELVLTIGLFEPVTRNDFSQLFPLKIGIKHLIIPLNSEPNQRIKIEVLLASTPSSRPAFLHLNQTVVNAIITKNKCIGEWVQFLLGSGSPVSSPRTKMLANIDSVYSPILFGTYKLPKIRQIQIQIRSRITNSETFPILLKIGKINAKIQHGNYNIRIRPLQEGVQFVRHGLDRRVAYSSILLNALIYDKSRAQEGLLIEFESKTNSILLRNVNPNHPLESILLVERVGSPKISGSNKGIFEPRKKEWDVEIYLSSIGTHETPGYEEELMTKTALFGEILDPRETRISEIGGPFVFVDSEGSYSMVVYFFVLGHQYNKMMTISLGIPQSITEFVNTDLNVQVFPSDSPDEISPPSERGLKVTRYAQGRVISLTLESNEGFRGGWWGISIQISKPSVTNSDEESDYVEFNVSRSVSTLDTPYLTSLLFLSVHEKYKGPYLRPAVSKLQYIGEKNYIFQLVSLRQSHSSFHPFPMLKDQTLTLETNSPSYLVTKLIYMERFRFIYIIAERSLSGLEINLNTREIGNLGSSTCQIVSILGKGYYKQIGCDTIVNYLRLDSAENPTEEAARSDLALVKKLLTKLLDSKSRYTMNVVTLIVEEGQAEDYDKSLFESGETRPSERVNYNLIVKRSRGGSLGQSLRLDPSPAYFETPYQFQKALILSHYYNLYTVPSSIQAVKVCPPEVPFLSREQVQSQPLTLKYRYFRQVLSSYNYSVTPNIPGTCLRERLITSGQKAAHLSGFGLVPIALVLVLLLAA